MSEQQPPPASGDSSSPTAIDTSRRTAGFAVPTTSVGDYLRGRWDAIKAGELGALPIIRRIANIHHSSPGGDDTILRGLARGGRVRPFDNVHASGYRGLYDMAAPESSRFVLATGQSGHPLSRHYDDLGELWRRGEYIPMVLDRDLARAGGVGVTTLVPR